MFRLHSDSTPAIRICHVQVLPILSGVQRAMLDIFKQLDRQRFEIHVACQGPGPLTAELERQEIRWHAIPALDRPIRPHKDWRAYRQLYSLFQRQQFQIVHTHSSKPGVLGRIAARRAGVPTVIHTVQGFAFHEFSSVLKRCVYSRLEQWAGRYCDRVLFVNHEEHEMSVRNRLLPPQKCLTIYNGVDRGALQTPASAAARQQYRQAWRLADDEVAILFAARLEPQKQPLVLAEIATALRSRFTSQRWRLIIAGTGPAQARIEAQIAAMRLSEQVSLVGWLKDPHAALAAADVVLLPSLYEGLPLGLIEAQAAGLPVVASNVKGNREVVTSGTGFLCSARDVDAYADKLATLINDPLARIRLGRAASQHAEQKFDAAVNARQVRAIYDELAAASHSAPAERMAA
jgi:glycosyltransferase involved in cell wall biosynthesis